jgi:pimeloyl-ACP methyl ester carboxylesterase
MRREPVGHRASGLLLALAILASATTASAQPGILRTALRSTQSVLTLLRPSRSNRVTWHRTPDQAIQNTENTSDKTAYIMVHGLAGNTRQWKHIAKALAAKSNGPIALVAHNLARKPYQDVLAEIDRAANHARETGYTDIVVMGHSAGGTLAAIWAKNNPDRIKRLVTAGTPYLSPTKARTLAGKNVKRVLDGISFVSQKLSELLNNHELSQLAKNFGLMNDPKDASQLEPMLAGEQPFPVTNVVGRQDLVVPPELTTLSGRHSTTRRVQAGHLQLLWRPKAVDAIVAAALGQQTLPDPERGTRSY